MKNIFMSILAFFAITLTACGGEDPTPIPTPPPRLQNHLNLLT